VVVEEEVFLAMGDERMRSNISAFYALLFPKMLSAQPNVTGKS